MRRQYIKERPKKAIDVVNYLYGDTALAIRSSYRDKECTQVIKCGGRRSITALYAIAKGYFGNLKEDNFIREIIKTKKYGFVGCAKVNDITLIQQHRNANKIWGNNIPKHDIFHNTYKDLLRNG